MMNKDVQTTMDTIPDKMGFKIGEAADYVGVKQYVLRYWETEFEALHPRKSSNGQRFYTRKDIEMALTIRKLLHEDRFSIEGARAVLKKMKSQKSAQLKSQSTSQISPILEGTTVEQLVEKHQPAELLLNKTVAQTQVVMIPPSVEVVQKAIAQKERELQQNWSSSLDYLLEEIRQARKRLA